MRPQSGPAPGRILLHRRNTGPARPRDRRPAQNPAAAGCARDIRAGSARARCRSCRGHRQDQVEATEISVVDLPRAQSAQVEVAARRRPQGPRVRRFAHVVIVRACRVDLYVQLRRMATHELAKHPSAVGERQMLPMQTKRIRIVVFFIVFLQYRPHHVAPASGTEGSHQRANTKEVASRQERVNVRCVQSMDEKRNIERARRIKQHTEDAHMPTIDSQRPPVHGCKYTRAVRRR